jgi:hypothetical protein
MTGARGQHAAPENSPTPKIGLIETALHLNSIRVPMIQRAE